MAAPYQELDEYQNRLKKLREIISYGMDPYPHHYEPTGSIEYLQSAYENETLGSFDEAMEGKTPSVQTAGRMILFRAMGKNAFSHIQDSTGKLQILFNRDHTVVEGYRPENNPEHLTFMKFIEKKLDLGDIIGIEGNLFFTQKGELTLFAKKVKLLAKALLPLPDKHSKISDKGILYRKRWLDLIINKDSMERFKLRSRIFQIIRNYFNQSNFLEVETPVLQNIYGGAEARPFTTYLNDLDQEMYLRISLEISLKKLIVGGLNRVFEIGKVFRNEGIDRTHNPEFTLLECYASYWDYHDVMHFVENLFETIALEIYGTTKISVISGNDEIEIDVKAPWKRMTMKESIKQYAGFDMDALPTEEMRFILQKETDMDENELAGYSRGILISKFFEEFVEDQLIQPHHITDHPIDTTPLCKLHRDEQAKQERLVERFESFILGKEMTNAYSELNDPLLQRDLLEKQADKRLEGDETASPLDEEFLEAICQGMPPCGGLGIGLDRLVMLFTNAKTIKDVIFFPLMRFEEKE